MRHDEIRRGKIRLDLVDFIVKPGAAREREEALRRKAVHGDRARIDIRHRKKEVFCRDRLRALHQIAQLTDFPRGKPRGFGIKI